jgi:hypothetical protein
LFGRKARFLALGVALKVETDLQKADFFALPAIYLAFCSDAGSNPFMQGIVVVNGHNKVAILFIMGGP